MRTALFILLNLLTKLIFGQTYLDCNDSVNYSKNITIDINEDYGRLSPDSLKKIDYFGNLRWTGNYELNSDSLNLKVSIKPDTIEIIIENKRKRSLYFLNCYELMIKEFADINPYLIIGYYPGSDLSLCITLNELRASKKFTYKIPFPDNFKEHLQLSVYLVPDIDIIKSSIIHIDKEKIMKIDQRPQNHLVSSHTYRYNYYESIEILDKKIKINRR